jgi:PAS domain S-box-containing protein
MSRTGTPSVESILNTVIDAIIAIDEAGVIQSVNPAVEKIFGYQPQELIGRNVSVLMPNPYAREHDGYIRNYLRTGDAKIIGIGREVVAKKKDGTVFPVYLGVSEGRKAGGRRFFTGVIRDVTEAKRYQDSLKRQGEFTAAVLNTVRSLVMVLDHRGNIVNFNRACEETTGYSFQEVAGKPFWDFFVTMEEKDAVIKNFLDARNKRRVNAFEAFWLTKRGDKRLIAWSNSLLFDEQDGPEYVIGTGIDITERRHLERLVLDITRKEQERIGQELHDGLAQHLASTAIVAKVAEQKLAKESSPAAPVLKRVVAMVNQAVSQTRELAQGLYALEAPSDDLASSLKKLSRETKRSMSIPCAVDLEAGANVRDREAASNLYRIAREAVANAIKHGRCKRIRLRLRKAGPREGELTIENDGVPFRRARSGGLGLRIMQSRAAILNASLEIASKPGGGTVVRCAFPVPA